MAKTSWTKRRRLTLSVAVALGAAGLLTPRARAAEAPATKPADPLAAGPLDHTLPEVKFDGAALADGIDFLRDVTGLAIDVNWDALKAAGVYRETPVTVRLADVKPLKALQVILDNVGGKDRKLHQSVERGRIVVTSLDDYVAHNTEERTYDVRDLLAPKGAKAPTPDERARLVEDLSAMIRDTVAPDSWAATGGKPGAIKEKDGQLTITQTRENQQQVANLLDRLHQARASHDAATQPAAPRPGK